MMPPRQVVASTPGEAAADQFARRSVPRSEETWDAGRAVVVDDADAAGAPDGSLRDQGDLEEVGEGIDPQPVEDEKEVGLAPAHGPLLV